MTSMNIHLPNSAFIGNIDAFLAGFDPSDPETLNVTANKAWISVHPVVLAMVAALSLGVDPKKVKCEPMEAKSSHYLTRMGLFSFLKVPPPKSTKEHEPAGGFIPLKQIKNSKELSVFLEDMIPLLHLPPEQAKSIRYVIYEVVRNTFEHSGSESGAILCAQYFKKSNSFRIGIADTGMGVNKSISATYSPKTDLDALTLALTPGVTGTTRREGGSEQNGGAGLFFTKSIAYINRSYFMIYSGSGFYKLRMRNANKPVQFLNADPVKDNHSERNDLPYWQGTVVGIDISLSDTSEFQALLNLIGAVYSQGVKNKRKARFRKARFV
jgi:anti-sigma regulatory factor (Ser/Thr protein kinase)